MPDLRKAAKLKRFPSLFTRIISGVLISCFSLSSSAAASPAVLPDIPSLSSAPLREDNASLQKSESTQVQKFEVELGKTLDIPVNNPLFHLIKSPKIAAVVEKTPAFFRVRGEAMGETLLLIWEGTKVRTYRIVVTRPRKEAETIRTLQSRNSKLYQSQKDRSFKIAYDTTYSVFNEDRVLGRVEESRKLYDQNITVTGGTPVGDLKGNLFYEYRKSQQLGKSVAMPKNVEGGIYNTDLPGLQHYNLIGGTHYVSMDNFGVPGQRISGFMLEPNFVRQEWAKKGQVDTTFFIGEKRDGSVVDNPAGIQNRELKGRVSGQRLGYHLWKNGYVSAAHYNQWAGPRTASESKNNFTNQFDFIFPWVRIFGGGGIDSRRHVAGEIQTLSENSSGMLFSRFFGVDDHYKTITGSALDRGNRGVELTGRFFPLEPFFRRKFLMLTGDLEFVRNRISVNADHPGGYLKTFRPGMTLRLPLKLVSETRLTYEDRLAASFPYLHKKIDQKLIRDFRFNSRILTRMRLYLTAAIDGYTQAEGTPGFNSNRYEAGGGGTVNFRGGLWIGAKYLWNYLNERDPSTPPNPVTHPRQAALSGGWFHNFRHLPVEIYTNAYYINETQTHNKIHQPFFNENRLEVRGGLGWRIRPNAKLFVESSTSVTQSTIGEPDHAEFLIETGMRLTQDTHFYIPLKGQIQGSVFEDKNGNGQRDLDETGIAGYEVRIENGPKAKTDQKGYYRLKVKEGAVTLIGMDRIPEGYYFTTVNRQDLEVFPKALIHQDFGIAPQIQIKGAAYLDVNENAIQESQDIPLSGIQILLNSGQSAVTAGDGIYSILHILPGKNRVRVMPDSIPPGYRTLTPLEKSFDGTPGDLLNFNVALAAQRSGGGILFLDENLNGQWDQSEPGVAGVKIRVNGNPVKTDESGRYFAALKNGVNKIEIDLASLPEGTVPAVPEQEVRTGAEAFSKTDINFPIRPSVKADPS